mmetsp:Transcript_21025/g.42316  ORF Transcript_21025/g.42316 Transcript_21025/m.42316 type:complete len:234 (-) Transcript_21025:288-989(-)|eukprot:CAMPEP_0167797964 /NCGR_PEP_ID=MMETSP0111_2-20121227/15993_1 /TAXON_ID=91324 /ORGANISM="Lotharella globosa, Strain CCCM811" /LENGTH=233 /DNA_ID=CAMNT_0007692221 /DNA_START=137 /DNA_END=838 /DNA_ORIENTATION=+
MGNCHSDRDELNHEEGSEKVTTFTAKPLSSPKFIKLPDTVRLTINKEGIHIFSPLVQGSSPSNPLAHITIMSLLGWGSGKEKFKFVEEKDGAAHEWLFASPVAEKIIRKLNCISALLVAETEGRLKQIAQESESKPQMQKDARPETGKPNKCSDKFSGKSSGKIPDKTKSSAHSKTGPAAEKITTRPKKVKKIAIRPRSGSSTEWKSMTKSIPNASSMTKSDQIIKTGDRIAI